MCCANCRATEVCILIYSTETDTVVNFLFVQASDIDNDLWGTVICWVVQAICVQKKKLCLIPLFTNHKVIPLYFPHCSIYCPVNFCRKRDQADIRTA